LGLGLGLGLGLAAAAAALRSAPSEAISPYISLHLPTSPYISPHLPTSPAPSEAARARASALASCPSLVSAATRAWLGLGLGLG